MHLLSIFTGTVKGVGFPPIDRLNNFACHSFIHGCCLMADAESGPVRNKDSTIYAIACRLSFRFKSLFLCPKFPGATWQGGVGFRWTLCVWICVMSENVSLGNLWLSK